MSKQYIVVKKGEPWLKYDGPFDDRYEAEECARSKQRSSLRGFKYEVIVQ